MSPALAPILGRAISRTLTCTAFRSESSVSFHLPTRGLFVDVGANIGYHSLYLASSFPSAAWTALVRELDGYTLWRIHQKRPEISRFDPRDIRGPRFKVDLVAIPS